MARVPASEFQREFGRLRGVRRIPEVSSIHVVAEATDDGAPALTRYERFVVTVR